MQGPGGATSRFRPSSTYRKVHWLALLCLASWGPLFTEGQSYSVGRGDVTGSKTPPDNLGKTEGCFIKFDYVLSVVYPRVQLDNRVCQVYCGSQRFSVSATSASSCFCGLVYPAAQHRVRDDLCDNPCSADARYCYAYSCCGNKNGTHFTVAFANQMDPVLELLRQLAFDFRQSHSRPEVAPEWNNPVLRRSVTSLMGATAPLQLLSSGGSNVNDLSGAVTLAGGGGIGLQGQCPEGFSEYRGDCYFRVFGGMFNYGDAQGRCKERGAALVVVRDAEEDAYVTQALFAKPGWIGLTNRYSNAFFEWDGWTNWGTGEPAGAVTYDKGSLAGSVASSGTTPFTEMPTDGVNLRRLVIGVATSQGRVTSLQAEYRLANGSTLVGLVWGAPSKSTDSVSIPLSPDQYLSGAGGQLVSGAVWTLGFTLTDSAGNSQGYGPYGSTSAQKGVTDWFYRASGVIVGLHGSVATNAGLQQLGFIELTSAGCAQLVTVSGQWRAVPCSRAYDSVSYACMLRPTSSLADCPAAGNWVRYGSHCYKVVSGNGVSWVSARQACANMQSTLARIDSPEVNEFLARAFSDQSSAFGFIGLRDVLPFGQVGRRSFQWDTYANWAANQPVKTPRGGCVMMDGNQRFSVVSCTSTSTGAAVVCEGAPLGTSCSCESGWVGFGCRCYMVQEESGRSWLQAAALCDARRARLADVNSVGEQAFLGSRLLPNRPIYLGRRDLFASGVYTSDYFVNWAEGEPGDGASGVQGNESAALLSRSLCGVIRGDGQWYAFPCLSSFPQALCRRSKDTPVGGLQQGTGEEFTMTRLGTGADPQWGNPLDVNLQHNKTGAYLGIDSQGNVFTSTTASEDTALTLMALQDGRGFTIRRRDSQWYLSADQSMGRLTSVFYDENQKRRASRRRTQAAERAHGVRSLGDEAQEWEEEPAVWDARRLQTAQASGVAVFSSPGTFAPLSLQNLQMGVAVQKSEAMPHPRFCSLKVYDLTATSQSFACSYVSEDGANLPRALLEVSAFTIQDKTTNLNQRTPLPNGRTACENQSPTDTLTCTYAYGEGLTFTRTFSVQTGYQILNQFQVDGLSLGGNVDIWLNWAYMYTNGYTDTTTNTYVESRNWAANVPVPPLKICTIQFWLSSVDVSYVWQSILKATGSFELTSMGVHLGSDYALSDVSEPADMHFYQWGRYRAPAQAEIIITVDEADAAKYTFDVPDLSTVVDP